MNCSFLRHIIYILLLFNSHSIILSSNQTEDNTKIETEVTHKDFAHCVEQAQSDRKDGNLTKAIIHYQQALDIEPNNCDILLDLAESYHANRNISAAINCYKKALIIDAHHANAHYNLAVCYYQIELTQKAAEHLHKTIEYNSEHAGAYIYLANIEVKKNNHEQAVAHYHKALELDPNNFDAYYHLGCTLKKIDNMHLAIEKFRTARKINSTHIGNLFELANTFNILNQTDKAIDLYMNILEINPNIYAALYNIGYTLKKQGHLKEAVDIYERILKVKPDYALAHFSLAVASLALGDFQRGWQEYEWRWKTYNEVPKQFTEPVWNGSDLCGKTIFVYAEQGLGDTLQFVRYLKVIKEQGATVIFETQRPLKSLLSLCPYIDHVITKYDQLPKFDFHIALMSLPLILDTRIETIPSEMPFLYADEDLVDYWQEKLKNDTHFKIGICWHGNGRYTRKALQLAIQAKCVPLQSFAPIAAIDGISLYSLQKVDGTDQIKKMDNVFTLHTFDLDFDQIHGRFMDTAAVMQNLDLIISVDTATAHLAGGLGIPTWILLPKQADWRWMCTKTDSPWYPTMRLFRQSKTGNWNNVIQTIADELKKIVRQKTKTTALLLPNVPVEDIIDQVNRPSKTRSCNNNLKKAYHYYVEKHPKLKLLAQSMANINKQLYAFDEQLKKSTLNVFDKKHIELARNICYAHDVKNHLKKSIKETVLS